MTQGSSSDASFIRACFTGFWWLNRQRWWVLSECSVAFNDVSDVFLSTVMMLTATKPQLIRPVKGQLEVVETDSHGEKSALGVGTGRETDSHGEGPEFGPEGLGESLLRTVRSLGVLSAQGPVNWEVVGGWRCFILTLASMYMRS